MTGPEHYRKAEDCMTAWQDAVSLVKGLTDDAKTREDVANLAPHLGVLGDFLAAAQAHATLALAAATAQGAFDPQGQQLATSGGWQEVL